LQSASIGQKLRGSGKPSLNSTNKRGIIFDLWFGQAHRKTQISERKRSHKTTKSLSKLKSLSTVNVNGNKTGFVIIHFQTTTKINLMQDLFKEQQLRLNPLHDDNSVISILDYWKGVAVHFEGMEEANCPDDTHD
jgi:hypothetical protein